VTGSIEQRLKEVAREAGFAAVGIARADSIPQAAARLRQCIALGRHGDMDWMASTADRRAAPKALWPEVESVVMLAMSYTPDRNPLVALTTRDRGAIACYAEGRDYHDVVKPALKRVASWLQREVGGEVKVFVDTAPVMEKPLAEAAGLGWQGRHTNLVSRELGSWFFLGAIFATARLQPDKREPDHCGSCRACLDICPTAAFPAPYQLDARRCISYLTIEHKGVIARQLRPLIGNRIYGCDDCLAVCPWNKFAKAAADQRFARRAETRDPPLRDLMMLDDAAFRARFRGTPVKRTGRDRFLRNVLIAAGNSGDAALVPSVLAVLDDASALVRGAAVWAAGRLLPPEDFQRLAEDRLPGERDPIVIEEWETARS
jgi:epoxyqueuosine reductase